MGGRAVGGKAVGGRAVGGGLAMGERAGYGREDRLWEG